MHIAQPSVHWQCYWPTVDFATYFRMRLGVAVTEGTQPPVYTMSYDASLSSVSDHGAKVPQLSQRDLIRSVV